MSKKVKNHNLKDKLFKILHVICYILSALFIVISIIAGVKSCEKTTSVSAETEYSLKHVKSNRTTLNNNDYYVYRFKYQPNSTFTINRNEQSLLFDDSLGDFDTYYDTPYIDSNVYFVNFNEPAYILDSQSNLLTGINLCSNFRMYSDDAPIDLKKYKWCLAGLYYTFELNESSSYSYFATRKYDQYDDPDTYDVFGSVPYIYLTEQLYDNSYLSLFFEPVYESQSLIFNKQWNYNAFLGTNLNGLYGSASFDSDGENMRYKLYNTGYFVSNGQVFNQIQIWAIQSNGNTVYSVSQGTSGGLMRAPDGYWIYSFVYYRNTITNYEVLVNYHDMIPYSTSSGSTSLYYANSSTWVNDSFRYITFLEPLSDNLRIQLNSFNNNNQNYYSGQIYNDGYDVFTLLSFAFTSLSDFWAISILPGISIGVLFFLPAVVGVVIIIVHILRK